MFIQTETTPNPSTLKFIPGEQVMKGKTANYENKDALDGKSPLAELLFDVDGVESVFLGQEFITITKSAEQDWKLLKPVLLSAIMDHYLSGKEVYIDNTEDGKELEQGAAPAGDYDADDEPVVRQIIELIDTRVRPAVAMDGGDIIFHSFREGIVNLELHGSCSGCPSSTVTLKQGIEGMLKHYVPEVNRVEAV